MARVWQSLKRRQDFLGTAASGLKRATPGCVIQARRSPSPGIRVGFTASRKVGIAVARSRAKRRLRAAIDRVLSDMTLEGWDLVLIARTETLTRDFSTMASDIGRAVVRLTQGETSGRAA